MKTKQILALSILVAALFTSCFKEDDKIDPHQPGNMEIQTIGMGQYYENQAYFDLGTNTLVGINSKDIFDLMFSNDDSLPLIKLNSAKFMRAISTGDTNFFGITDTTGMKWNYDAISGNTDSVVIKDWMLINQNDTVFTKKTFIIDRGINATGVVQGIRKIRVLDYKPGFYTIEYANLDNSKHFIVSVKAKGKSNFVQLNLNQGDSALNLEPDRENWDLFFTQYTDILTTSIGEKYPYLVTGVLINQHNVEVAMDSTIDFEEITIDYINTAKLKTHQNVIGYDWKWYDFDAGFYTVITKMNYIIKDTEGYYYKLRFVGFYNNQGQKGYPIFEFQRL